MGISTRIWEMGCCVAAAGEELVSASGWVWGKLVVNPGKKGRYVEG